MQEIVTKLHELSEMQAAADVMRLDYEAKRAEILKAVQAELDALEAEYKPLMDSVTENIAALEVEIKNDVLAHGASVKGDRLYAMYSRGRVTWDTQALDRYVSTHPEVKAWRKEGAPSVSLRVVK